MALSLPLPDDTPPLVLALVAQIIDPATMNVLAAAGERHVDVTLHVHRGRAVREPKILVGGA